MFFPLDQSNDQSTMAQGNRSGGGLQSGDKIVLYTWRDARVHH